MQTKNKKRGGLGTRLYCNSILYSKERDREKLRKGREREEGEWNGGKNKERRKREEQREETKRELGEIGRES